jgi:hypothetical protein
VTEDCRDGGLEGLGVVSGLEEGAPFCELRLVSDLEPSFVENIRVRRFVIEVFSVV